MHGAVEPGDVLLAIDGANIADDGSIAIGSVRGPFQHQVDMKQIGDVVEFSVWRGGKRMKVQATARRIGRFDRRRLQWGKAPRFVVYAGMVFMPLEVELLRTEGRGWAGKIPRAMAWHYFYKEWEQPDNADDEAVVLARVLQHPVNVEMSVGRSVVEKINGQSIRSLAELDAAITRARQRPEGFLTLEFSDGFVEAVDLAAAEAAHSEILKTYGVRRDKHL